LQEKKVAHNFHQDCGLGVFWDAVVVLATFSIVIFSSILVDCCDVSFLTSSLSKEAILAGTVVVAVDSSDWCTSSSAAAAAALFVSSLLSLISAVFVILWVREPDRGAKEKVLQDMLQAGNK
jgi:hypothetical protein